MAEALQGNIKAAMAGQIPQGFWCRSQEIGIVVEDHDQ